MKIELDINPDNKERKIIIKSDEMTKDIEEILKYISNIEEGNDRSIVGQKNEKIVIIKKDEIVRIYSLNKKVIAETLRESYEIKFRLYEIEDLLNQKDFIRISKSEIINLKKVKCFDVSLMGSIEVEFVNGNKTYVSRRYVKILKEKVGI